jgi:hypothetical protein
VVSIRFCPNEKPDRLSLTGHAHSAGATAARVARHEFISGTVGGTLDQTSGHCVCRKPSSSAAELDCDAFRTDPHDMCPRWFGWGWNWRPQRKQRTQGISGNEIDAAQVDDQYAAVPHQPSGVRAHLVYVGRVDLVADGDYGSFGIGADPQTGSRAIYDSRGPLR